MTIARSLPTLCLAATTLVAGLPATAAADTREELTLKKATVVLEEMQQMPDLRAPNWLLARSEGIVVLPEVAKFALGVGGRLGTGVLLVRGTDGKWSNPVFVSLGGASIGWQAGGQAADIVLVFTTRQSVEGITGGKLTLGADASVAAGPVGRTASASTTPMLDAEIYSFSRTRGLFAGVSLEGSVLAISRKANATFYRKPGVKASEILAASAPASPPPGPALLALVAKMTGEARAEAAARPARQSGATSPASPPTPAKPGANTGDQAQTFPLEDKSPGTEPPHHP